MSCKFLRTVMKPQVYILGCGLCLCTLEMTFLYYWRKDIGEMFQTFILLLEMGFLLTKKKRPHRWLHMIFDIQDSANVPIHARQTIRMKFHFL